MPPNLTQKPAKLIKPDSQTSISSTNTNLLLSSPSKAGSPVRTNNIPQATTPTTKRSSSKTSYVLSKIFK